MLKGKTLTPSNVLSFARVLLLIPIYRSLAQNTPEGNAWALAFMGLAVLSDFLDGYLARRLSQISDVGKVLDPLADKICIVSVSWFLASPIRDNAFPLWVLIIILIRETIVVAFGYLIYRRIGLVTTSNIWGKTTSTVLAALLIVYTLQIRHVPPWLATWLPPQLDRFLLWLSLSFMLVSTITYARRFYQLMSQHKNLTYNSGVLTPNQEGPQAPPNGSEN